MSLTRRTAILGAAGLGLLAACSKDDVELSIEKPWVRTTDDSQMPFMSAAYMTIVNPGKADVRLTGASTSVAGVCQIHEMVDGPDGKKIMREAEGGAVIPAGSHLHLTPGGYHVMLMDLKEKLPVGDEVTIDLEFSTGKHLTITAPVKVFTEEEDHYHETHHAKP